MSLVSLLEVVVVVNDLHGKGTQRKSQTYVILCSYALTGFLDTHATVLLLLPLLLQTQQI